MEWTISKSKFMSIKKRLDGLVLWRNDGDNVVIRIEANVRWIDYVRSILD